MKINSDQVTQTERSVYTTPSVTLIEIKADVITTSSTDENMGEWDTEI